MIDCPGVEQNLEQINKLMSAESAIEYDRIVDPTIIEKIREFLIVNVPELPLEVLRNTTDTFVYYTGELTGYLAEFTNSCSLYTVSLPFSVVKELILLIGINI